VPPIWRSPAYAGLKPLITGAAKANIVVRIRTIPIQVECERARVGSVIPIRAAKEHTAAFYDFPLTLTKPLSSTLKASCLSR